MPAPPSDPTRPERSTIAVLQARYAALPRAAQWLGWFVVAMVAYFVIIEPVLGLTAQARGSAADARDRVASLEARLNSLERAQAELATGITDLGAIMPLGEQDTQTALLRDRITSILVNRGFAAWDLTQARPIAVPRNALDPAAAPVGRTVLRVGFDLTLEGSPDAVLGVLADLEQAPEVTLVRQSNLRRVERDGRGFLSATISPEVWVLTPDRAGGGT
jgi:hypothetical protein